MMNGFQLKLLGAIAIMAAPAYAGIRSDANSIPEPFQGIWDASEAACKLAASDMRGYVDAKRFRFADTIGAVQRVEKLDDKTITVLAELNSEGDLSTEAFPMKLSASGNKLVTHGNTSRVRCPEVKDQ